MGMVPEPDVNRVRLWASTRYPPHLRNEMRPEIEVSDSGITVFECRPPLRPDHDVEWTRLSVVGFEYAGDVDEWSLLWRDSLNRMLPYRPAMSSCDITELFQGVDDDAGGIFWG